MVSIYWQGVAPFPWYLNEKGPTRIGSTCIAHISPHSADWLAGSRKLAARCPVSGCWPSCSISYGWGATSYKAKRLKTHCYQEEVGQFELRFQREWVVSEKYFLVSTKLDAFCYPTVQTAPYYVPSFWHNTGVWQTDGRTDRKTDGIAVASTALAMRALRHAVKKWKLDIP